MNEADLDALVERLAAAIGVDRDRLLTIQDLAERLGFSPCTVARMVRRGELPRGYLLGGSWRWSWSAVLKFLGAKNSRRRRNRRGRRCNVPAEPLGGEA